jgi:chorismate mutase
MSIESLRREIDQLDAKIVRALNKRATAAVKIGALKRKSGIPVRDTRRERDVLAKVCSQCKGILGKKRIEKIYRQIVAACVSAEHEERRGKK